MLIKLSFRHRRSADSRVYLDTVGGVSKLRVSDVTNKIMAEVKISKFNPCIVRRGC